MYSNIILPSLMRKYFLLLFIVLATVFSQAQDTKLLIQNVGGAEYFTFSADGKYMATAGPGGVVKVWTREGVLLKSFMAHESKAMKVLFTPDSTQLFSMGEEYVIKQWTLDGRYIRSYGTQDAFQRAFYDMALSPDGRFMATADGNNGVVVWRTDGSLYRVFKAPNLDVKVQYYDSIIVHALAFSPDSTRITAGGGLDYYTTPNDYRSKKLIGRMYTWNISGVLERSFILSGDVFTVEYSEDGKYLLTMLRNTPRNSEDVWDVSVCGWTVEGKKLSEFPDLYNKTQKVFWLPGKTTFLDTATLSEWDINGNQLTEPTSLGIYATDFFPTPDGVVAKVSKDAKESTVFYKYDGNFVPIRVLPTGSQNIVHLKTGKSVCIAQGWTNDVTVFNYESGTLSYVDQLAWPFDVSADGAVIAGMYTPMSNNDEYTGQYIRILRKDGSLVRTFQNDVNYAQSLAVSADGKMIAVGYTTGDYTNPTIHCRIYTITGELVRIIPVTGREIGSLEFSPDGKQLLCVTGYRTPNDGESSTISEVSIFSINGGLVRKIARSDSNDTIDAVYDRSGSKILTWTYNSCSVWTSQGKLVQHYDIGVEEGGVYRFLNGCDFSADGAKIIVGHRGNTVSVWSLDGRLDKNLYGHAADVYTVQSLDGNFAVSGSSDGSLRFWNTKNGQSVAVMPFKTSTLYSYNAATSTYVVDTQQTEHLEWFISNDAGYFDCSNGGRDYVKFVRGMVAYEPEQFWQEFFTPGLLSEFLTGVKPLPQQSVGDVSSKAPVVRIISPTHESVAPQAIMTIRVDVKDGTNGVGQVFLYHNGKAINEKTRGISVRKEQGGIEFTVELMDGANSFIAAAFDKDGVIEGRSEPITVRYTASYLEKPSMYIIAVGVSNYKDVNIRLTSPRDDASALTKHLKQVAEGMYGSVETTVLLDSEATVKGIMKAMNDVVARAKIQDTVVIFFAGHGITVKGKYYFLPYEADVTQVEASCITTDDLSDFIRGIAAKKIALLMDTCQSGSAVRDLGVVAMTRSVEERRLVATLAKDQGIAVFSASSESQAAYEIRELGHGIFTWCVINALTVHRDEITRNGVITIGGLLDYVSKATRETAFKYLKTDQSPVMYNFGDNFSLGMAEK